MTRLWGVRGGKKGEFEDAAVKRNKMALGWDKTGDLSKLNRTAILERLQKAYPDAGPGTLNSWAGQLYRFVNEISVGDIVVMPCKGKSYVFIGKVDGEYDLDPDSNSEFRHLRPVEWNQKPIPRNLFGEDMRFSFDTSKTVFEVKAADAVNRVRAVLENGSDPGYRVDPDNFDWVPFYEAVADRLLDFRDRRKELIDKMFALKSLMDEDNVPFTSLEDIFKDESRGRLEDICPFTTIGTFTRDITPANREAVAHAFAESFGIQKPWPDFSSPDNTGIPLLFPVNSWFFGFAKERQNDDIDRLWEIFHWAIEFAGSHNKQTKAAFIKAYDEAMQVLGTSSTYLTMGLYWIRPYDFFPLDKNSRKYIEETLKVPIPDKVSASEYLEIRDDLKAKFKEKNCPVDSFPALSLAAWKKKYSVADIMKEGCFLESSRIEEILERLQSKKNIVLQGPPGTGKTWLAKKLAFALMEKCAEDKVRSVQFHPNLSYEDFVRGWRPSSEGKLELVDGPFLEIAETARNSPDEKYVLVIEEINRGNPAQILGELLTLLEADKRNEESALALCYPRQDGEKIFIPENLYVIGSMNIADRSLALVDFALRRRFAFIDLEPAMNDSWLKWCREECGINDAVLRKIRSRIESLNKQISDDLSLGPQFRIGHSYVTPNSRINDPDAWFSQVVRTEIAPLLDEYWFDNPEKAREAVAKLLEGD